MAGRSEAEIGANKVLPKDVPGETGGLGIYPRAFIKHEQSISVPDMPPTRRADFHRRKPGWHIEKMPLVLKQFLNKKA
ncbi:hypothetical protein GCM10010924_43720 [Rhizobium wenxiniae]|nr:hypothetical protein GCM10010924_43720 [Rhizobium wenxiniae]